jgi:dolichol-phosphate mannosyltransferase
MNASTVRATDGRPRLTVVVPAFNEQECFPILLERLLALRPRLGRCDLEVLFVNDGSTDNTTALMQKAARDHDCVKVVHLSRNFGHQPALTAGLDRAEGDYVCVIDADLQDPPEVIPDMLAVALADGYDVVYGVRRTRAGETWFKLTTASLFYRFLTLACRVNIPPNAGDFRLISRQVVLSFRQMRETHRFVRGMIAWAGFKSTPFMYDRQGRAAGKTKYSVFKMARFALDATLSFSNLPVLLSIYLGAGMIAIAILAIVAMLCLSLFTTYPVPGIAVVLSFISITSGIQLIVLGLVGEYAARVFEQTKNRPIYLTTEPREKTD